MICSLLIDADDSPDFPGSTATAFGRPLAAYPMMAARGCGLIGRHYALTASPPVKSIAAQNGAVIIDPPSDKRARDLPLLHGYKLILEDLKAEKKSLRLLCVFSAQTPTITADIVEAGIQALIDKPAFDSAASASPYNRFHPLLARRVGEGDALEPFLRASAQPPAGDVWYPDSGVQILRPETLGREPVAPAPPLWWLGAKVFALKQWGGGPVDFQWQIPAVEFWLKKHGVSDITHNLELQPKPQPAAPKHKRR